VDSCVATTDAIFDADWEVSGSAGGAGLGRRADRVGAAVHRSGVAGLFARPRKSAEHCEHRIAPGGADADCRGMDAGVFVEFILNSETQFSCVLVVLCPGHAIGLFPCGDFACNCKRLQIQN